MSKPRKSHSKSTPPTTNWRLIAGIMGLLILGLVGAIALGQGRNTAAPTTIATADLALGEQVYAQQCALCHGANLEGEANWREYNPDGSFRSPPHDDTGHTWHHGDRYLFERTKYGTAALPADSRHLSDMPSYEAILTDEEIWAVLAYIKTSWSAENQQIQANITANE
jgi:mono/diheme cytochrome c family protein